MLKKAVLISCCAVAGVFFIIGCGEKTTGPSSPTFTDAVGVWVGDTSKVSDQIGIKDDTYHMKLTVKSDKTFILEREKIVHASGSTMPDTTFSNGTITVSGSSLILTGTTCTKYNGTDDIMAPCDCQSEGLSPLTIENKAAGSKWTLAINDWTSTLPITYNAKKQ